MVLFVQADAPVNGEKTVCFIDKYSLNIVDDIQQKLDTSIFHSSLVNAKVAEFTRHQPHGGSNHSLSVKSTKIEKQKGVSHSLLF